MNGANSRLTISNGRAIVVTLPTKL